MKGTNVIRLAVPFLIFLGAAACRHEGGEETRLEGSARDVIAQVIAAEYPTYEPVSTAARCANEAATPAQRAALENTRGDMTNADKTALALAIAASDAAKTCLARNNAPALA